MFPEEAEELGGSDIDLSLFVGKETCERVTIKIKTCERRVSDSHGSVPVLE